MHVGEKQIYTVMPRNIYLFCKTFFFKWI